MLSRVPNSNARTDKAGHWYTSSNNASSGLLHTLEGYKYFE
ncbi:hypothetical protein [Maribacter sp. 2307UL18-2]